MKIFTTCPKAVRKLLIGLLVAALWLGIWQLVSAIVAQQLLIPSPMAVLQTLLRLLKTPVFWNSVASSCLKILAGFTLGTVAGTLLAVLTTSSRFLHAVFSPALKVIKATPVASFIILALVWVRSANLSIFISFLMVVPLVWGNVSEGILATDPKLLEMAKVFCIPFYKRMRLIYLPSVLPYFAAACSTGIGFAWKSGIAAEVLGNPQNTIGEKLYDAKIYLETPELFAWTAVVILLSVLIEKGFLWLLRRIRLTGPANSAPSSGAGRG